MNFLMHSSSNLSSVYQSTQLMGGTLIAKYMIVKQVKVCVLLKNKP